MFKKGLLFSKFSHDLGSPFFNETLKMSFLPDLCCPGKARELAAVGPRVPLRDFARLTPTRPWSGTTHSSNSESLRLLTASIFQCIIISPLTLFHIGKITTTLENCMEKGCGQNLLTIDFLLCSTTTRLKEFRCSLKERERERGLKR